MAPRKAPEKNILTHGNEAQPEVEKPKLAPAHRPVTSNVERRNKLLDYITGDYAVEMGLKRADLRAILIVLQDVPRYLNGPAGRWTRRFPPGS